MTALTDFLLARLDADEAGSRADLAYLETRRRDEFDEVEAEIAAQGERFARRVLAECEAKRRIVDMYQSREAQAHEHTAIAAHATGLLLALRALASVYADHPDYRQEWRP